MSSQKVTFLINTFAVFFHENFGYLFKTLTLMKNNISVSLGGNNNFLTNLDVQLC